VIRRRFAIPLGALCAVLVFSASAPAQPPEPPARLELGLGVRWIGREPLGAKTATETIGAGGASTLFSTQSELGGVAGVDGRVGVFLTRTLIAEAEASFLKPQLRIAISGDAEGAAPVTATETIEQFTIGGNLVWRLPGRRWSPRFAPFAAVGGGYLRQLHEQGTFVATGRFFHVGGGVNALLVPARRFHTNGIGIRADLRALIRRDGVSFRDGSKASPSAGASVFVRF
jgi:hypothetical protein